MRKLLIIVVGSCASLAAYGEDLLQCVDPAVQQGLLFWRPSDYGAEISDETPAAIASLRVPGDFAWIAGAVSGVSSRGAFRTVGEPAAALEAAVAEMARDGWTADTSFRTGGNAFDGPDGRQSQEVCRDGKPVGIETWRQGDVTYVTYGVPINSENSVCRRGGMPSFNRLPIDDHLPRLEFASLDSGARTRRGSGGGSGAAQMTNSTRVTRAADLGTLTSHLEDQLIAQGWQADANWVGNAMAGSTWSRQSDDARYYGELDVIVLAESDYEVMFTIKERRP